MSKIKLKVCGMRNASNILEVASLGPDYLGFIFYKKSPRYVGEDFNIPNDFPATIKRVGVFVDEITETIKALWEKHDLTFIQLHGNESAGQCRSLKDTGLGVIKVFSVDDEFDFDRTVVYKSHVDYFLFDTKGKYHGGNAKTFNWEILKKYDQEIPFFLSGGISPENIAMIRSLEGMNIHAIDINSGVEISPAVKDAEAIEKVYTILNSATLK